MRKNILIIEKSESWFHVAALNKKKLRQCVEKDVKKMSNNNDNNLN